jgi:hypothetical protein
MLAFHGTDSDNIEAIKNNGLQSTREHSQWIRRQRNFHTQIDKKASAVFNGQWIKRTDALYLWPIIDDCIWYCETNNLDRIVTVDVSTASCLRTISEYVETAFREYES